MLVPVPIGNPVQISQASGGAYCVINNGPGNLYVYRNAACNINSAYDSVIGIGGSYAAPGGELWAVSDQVGCTVVALSGDGVVNSGSVTISGAVTVTGTVSTAATGTGSGTGGGTSTAAVFRDAYLAGASGNVGTDGSQAVFRTPTKTVTGDLMIAVAATYAGNNPSISGWTQGSTMGGGSMYATFYTKVATSSDASGGTSYYTGTWSRANGPGFLCCVAIANATTLTQPSGSTMATVSGNGYTSIALGTTAQNNCVINITVTRGTVAVGGMTWPSTTSGGPPNPQTAWSTPCSVADSSIGGGLTVSCASVTWSTTGYYDLITNNSSAICYSTNYLAA